MNDDGQRELRIDYGRKEVTFDEPHLFPFGEQLVSHSSFTCDEAITWGPGYRWEEIGPLLEALVSEGIIKRGDGEADPRGSGLVPSLVPPSACPFPRSWTATECEALTRDLAGRPVEFGYLETFVPMFRIAHPALDMDGRQVGEANVFPPRLRLDRETEWRVCQYPGSRYQDDFPMNVTALRAMIKHWKPMMATLLLVRAEFRERLVALGRPADEPSDRRWTIGDLHSFACLVLAVPAFALRGPSPPAQLHPVLSSVFRITDGIRMTTYEMLLSIEHPRRGDEPLTASQLYDYAENEAVLIGDTGVCAGPRPMIEEFLATVVDGTGGERLDTVEIPAEVRDTLAELPRAVDYGLHGLAVWALTQSIWLAMSRAQERLMIALRSVAGAERLRARLDAAWIKLERMQITTEHGRDVHRHAYETAYEQATRMVRAPVTTPTLADALAPRLDPEAVRVARGQLETALTSRALDWTKPDLDLALDSLLDYICAEQAVLTATAKLQHAINELLGQPTPNRPLCVRDFLVFYLLNGSKFPYLFDALDDELRVSVSCTATTISIVDHQAAPHAAASSSASAS